MGDINDEVQMELDMLRAIAGDERVEEVRVRDDAPASMRTVPSVRILISRDVEIPAELVLWVGFHDAGYPSAGTEESVPLVIVELEENAERRFRPEVFEEKAKAAAAAEGGQMCLHQVYQTCVDALIEADAAHGSNAAKSAAAAAAEAAAANSSKSDPTIRVGTQMSPEVFIAWKNKFDADRAAKRAKETEKVKKVAVSGVRLTGKQMWDQTIATADFSLFEKTAGGADGGAGDEDGEDGDDIDYIFEDDDDDEEDEMDFGEDDGDDAEARRAELERELSDD